MTTAAYRRAGQRRIAGLSACLMVCLAWLPLDAVGGDPPERVSETAVAVKAHMKDGSVVLFPAGLAVEREGSRTWLRGSGRELAVPDVLALEYYNERLDNGALGRSVALDDGAVVDALHSSPSVYAFDGTDYVLEAEAFSTNMLAATEARDLDRLDAGTAVDGLYRLRIRNHAWETQYLNTLLLRAVDHSAGTEVLPTRKQDVVIVGAMTSPERVTSKDGREVGNLLAERDGRAYRTSAALTDELTRRVARDWVEFEARPPHGAETLYVAMRVRNTLFSNVLLEEALLTGRGPETMDLLGGERFRLLEMWRLYRWVRKHMGLRVLSASGERFRVADRIGGTGPSAWRQVVSAVPLGSSDPVRIRLVFLADTWVIDWVAVSYEGRDRIRPLTVPLAELSTTAGTELAAAALAADDERYLALYPGETVEAAFAPPRQAAGLQRTYLVETRGYFIKWLGPGDFVGSTTSFRPDEENLHRAARHWLNKKKRLEEAFVTTRTGSH